MKTIALIDFQTKGHHYAFIRLFAKYVVRNNYKICIIYPEKGSEIKNYLIEQGADSNNIFYFESSVQKRVVRFLARFNNAFSTLLYWRETRNIIARAERANNITCDFVFFAWLDDYLSNDLHHYLVDFVFPYQWSGLFFHPWYLHEPMSSTVSFSSVDSVLLSKNCFSVAVHDEFIMEILKSRIKKTILLFPEIADSTAPDLTYDLAKELGKRASGRLVIGLIGLEKRKGILDFKRLIEQADPNRFFFFLAGELRRDAFTIAEFDGLNNFLVETHQNLFYFPYYLEEGAKINSVICAMDILFLVYHDFKSSSNYCTKVAHFKKRVLATDRYWIGDVTRKYNLGKVVKEGEISKMIDCLGQLELEIRAQKNIPLYTAYLEVHDESNLLSSFKNISDPAMI